jgi:SSS family solute:Na+ symporter
LWRRLFHHNALLLGWVAGIAYSVALIMHLKFQTSVYPVLLGSHTIPIYVGILALMLNLLVASLATVAMDWLGMPRLPDAITDEDFLD